MTPSPPPVLIVTGASSGLGEATARLAARRGWAVSLVARRAERLEALAREVTAAGGRALPLPIDLGRFADLPQVVERTLAAFGRVDGLVNNAALMALGMGYPHVIRELAGEELRVNLVAPAELTRLALPSLEQSRGCIVNVGTLASWLGPITPYHVSKAALRELTWMMRQDLASAGVSVCLLELGLVATSRVSGRHSKLRPLAAGLQGAADAILGLLRRRSAYRVYPAYALGGILAMRLAFALVPGLGAAWARNQVRRHGPDIARQNPETRHDSNP